jgi:hypothetical protein
MALGRPLACDATVLTQIPEVLHCNHFLYSRSDPDNRETGTSLENGEAAAGDLWATIGTWPLMLAKGGD